MKNVHVELIRHLETAGNLESRYVGRTDEDLCAVGLSHSDRVRREAQPDILVISPLRRCLETALLSCGASADMVARMIAGREGADTFISQIQARCPDSRVRIIEDFRECDFGDFEYKNWQEMSGDADYQAWIDSGGSAPFPRGESPEAFRERCAGAFLRLMEDVSGEDRELSVRLVVHGGTIMSIMDRFALDQEGKSYYDWHVSGGGGYPCVWDFAKQGLRQSGDVL